MLAVLVQSCADGAAHTHRKAPKLPRPPFYLSITMAYQLSRVYDWFIDVQKKYGTRPHARQIWGIKSRS